MISERIVLKEGLLPMKKKSWAHKEPNTRPQDKKANELGPSGIGVGLNISIIMLQILIPDILNYITLRHQEKLNLYYYTLFRRQEITAYDSDHLIT